MAGQIEKCLVESDILELVLPLILYIFLATLFYIFSLVPIKVYSLSSDITLMEPAFMQPES